MGQVSWQGVSSGHYWIDVALGNQDLLWMIDTGLVDPLNRIGFEVEPAIYDQLLHSGQFLHFQYRSRRDASGRKRRAESGMTSAQLIDPLSRQRVGPAVTLYVLRWVPGVPNRVGSVFFHHLTGCRAIWDLDRQLWIVEFP